MTVADDYFARVRPLLGNGLSSHVIGVDDAELALPVLELLASCMLQHVVVSGPSSVAALLRHHAWKQPFTPLVTTPAAVDARIEAQRVTGEARVTWDAARRLVTLAVDPDDVFTRMDVSYHVARTLRDVLLHDAPWPDGTRWHGHPAWPFSPVATRVTPAVPVPLGGRHVLVVGCGSLGSEAIRVLAGQGARFTLVDGARVSVFNLARQWYGAEDVGHYKVYALQGRLGRDRVRASRVELDASDLTELEALLRADPPDLALLATGTHHHAAIGDLLWRRGIPHVAACCYPQARYVEVSVVSPRERTPCVSCFRGHLYAGAPAPPPITDEVAAFLYRPLDDATRARAYTDLVAEPASMIDTIRAAELLARCAVELCAPYRSPWFARMLADATTCLLGGNVAQALSDGYFAYGIREPGQVIRLGLEDIAGSADAIECNACGRHMTVALRESVHVFDDDAADRAFL